MDPQEVVEIVGGLYANTLIYTALSGLWVYDWLVTLGDEVKYAWRGKKTWVFWLFIANRYIPALYIIWINMVMFSGIRECLVSCPITGKWFPPLDTGLATILAQSTIATRVYAVTGRKKLLCSPLALLVITQAVWAILTVFIFPHAAQQLPEEILDLFRLCILQPWDVGAFAYFGTALAFDTLAFSIIVFSVLTQLPVRSLGITTLGSVILRDATLYFIVIFFIQFFALVFLFHGPIILRLLPGTMNPIFVPIMATHLMLSLKKSAANPAEAWSLRTMSFRTGTTISPGGESLHFAPRTFGSSCETLDIPVGPDEDDLELGHMP